MNDLIPQEGGTQATTPVQPDWVDMGLYCARLKF